MTLLYVCGILLRWSVISRGMSVSDKEQDAQKKQGLRIKAERVRLQWTQEVAAKKCGVSQGMWGKYERGEHVMGSLIMQKFIESGADFDFIVTGWNSAVYERDNAISEHRETLMGLKPINEEEELLRLYRLANGAGRSAFFQIARVIPMSDTTVTELAHSFCRAVVEKKDLFVAQPIPRWYTADVVQLLTRYRTASSKIKGVVRAACDCIAAQAGDDDFLPQHGCTGIEFRIMTFYQNATPAGRRAIDVAVQFDSLDQVQPGGRDFSGDG